MALESATYISDLVSTNPTSSDNLSQGDDHLRLLKSTIKATFPNVSGAVTPTHTELNYVDGVTSAIQTQLDAKAVLAGANTFTGNQTINGNLTVSGAVSGVFPAGTRLLFQQTAAPTGWTKDTTHNDKALRVVNGAVGTGGSLTFTSAFGSARSISGTTGSTVATGTVGDTALSISQIPAHDHFIASATSGSGTLTNTNYLRQAWDGTTNLDYSLKGFSTAPTIGLSSQTGSGGTHTHSFTGTGHTHSFSTTLDVSVAYVDVIIAVKD